MTIFWGIIALLDFVSRLTLGNEHVERRWLWQIIVCNELSERKFCTIRLESLEFFPIDATILREQQPQVAMIAGAWRRLRRHIRGHLVARSDDRLERVDGQKMEERRHGGIVARRCIHVDQQKRVVCFSLEGWKVNGGLVFDLLRSERVANQNIIVRIVIDACRLLWLARDQ